MLRIGTLIGLVLGIALAAALPAGAANRLDDPCRTREPTALDRRPEWRCVGLAKFHDAATEPEELEQAEPSKREHTARDDFGVAVSPDGRLYVQVAAFPQRRLSDLPGLNPDGKEADPERETFGYRLNPFTILGNDDRVLRLSTTSYPWRVFGAILSPGSDKSNCSGALVGPRHLLTAGHCIYGNGAWYADRKVGLGMKGVGNFPNGLKNHAWYFSVVGWTDWGDRDYDYGMIVLEDTSSTAHLGWLGWWSSNHSGGAWNFGYPKPDQTCAASPEPPLCNDYLYGDDGSIQTQNWGQLGYSMDMQNGQSGSPVYKYNGGDRRVIAINAYNAGGSGQNWGTRIRSAVSQNICNWIGASPSAYNDHGCY
jgi:V8-like Glu-specific endopeptidase